MSSLLTNVITIRGVEYEVSEIDGKTMRVIRQRLKETPETVEAYVVWRCCVRPVYKTLEDVDAVANFVIHQISEEAFRLSNAEEQSTKNG